MRWKKRLYQGNHPPIVPMSVWDAANNSLSSGQHAHPTETKPKERYAFWGLLRCGVCGCTVVAEMKKKRYVYYRCTHARGHCEERYVREEALDEQFREIVRRVNVDPDLIEYVRQGLRESLEDETAFHQEAVAELHSQLDQIKKWKNAVYEDRLKGRLSEAFWIEKMNQFEMEEARIISEISAHKTADTRYLERGSVTLELAQRAEFLYESASPQRKRKILRILLSNSSMTGGIITAAYQEPFEILLKMAGAWESEKPGPDMRKPGFEMWRG